MAPSAQGFLAAKSLPRKESEEDMQIGHHLHILFCKKKKKNSVDIAKVLGDLAFSAVALLLFFLHVPRGHRTIQDRGMETPRLSSDQKELPGVRILSFHVNSPPWRSTFKRSSQGNCWFWGPGSQCILRGISLPILRKWCRFFMVGGFRACCVTGQLPYPHSRKGIL